MSDYKPEEIAKRLDKGIPTGPELVKAAECIRGLDELIQMQEERIGSITDEIDRLQARLDAIPWEAIDQNVAVLETLMDVHAALHLDGPLACLRSIQALREEGGPHWNDAVEYIRSDSIPWEEIEQELSVAQDMRQYRLFDLLQRILALREQEEGNE